MLINGVVEKSRCGAPQGGPLSPLMANVLLDEVDRELERRGHCFVRYADDANVYVRSRRAVMALLKRLYEKLHLSVNESKSAVASAFGRKFLGYAFWASPKGVKRAVATKARKQFKQRCLDRPHRGQARPHRICEQ
jgi:RNA-directed DNA polymerase